MMKLNIMRSKICRHLIIWKNGNRQNYITINNRFHVLHTSVDSLYYILWCRSHDRHEITSAKIDFISNKFISNCWNVTNRGNAAEFWHAYCIGLVMRRPMELRTTDIQTNKSAPYLFCISYLLLWQWNWLVDELNYILVY